MKRGWFLIPLLLATACLRRTPPPDTGILVTVTIGPTCPVVRVDQPCPDRPYQAQVVVTDSSGQVAARAQTDGAGMLRLALAPGDYQVKAMSNTGAAYPRPAIVDAHVDLGLWTQVNVIMDSGIR